MTLSMNELWPYQNRKEIPTTGGQQSEVRRQAASPDRSMNWRGREPKKIALFGHFDGTNFGNESSLQAVLYHLRQHQPEADITCICSDPQVTAATYDIQALPFSGVLGKPWTAKRQLSRVGRKIFAALREPFRWIKCIQCIRGTEMLVIPGTGLLTDAYGLRGWGPYGLLKWSLIAKACRCKVALVSVGAGPVRSTLGRWCIRSILSLAEYRSYRDASSVRYLENIGLAGADEAIFPDLAFSLPASMIPAKKADTARPVVGLGVIGSSGIYSGRGEGEAAYQGYLDALVESSRWLLDQGYDIRLLSGDLADSVARAAFRRALEEKMPNYDRARVIDEPVNSVTDVLSHIASTDFVVATRFHNIVFGFLCGKPVISISFHHKCESIMAMMGMSDYSVKMTGLQADQLIDAFGRLEKNAPILRPLITGKATAFRQALDRQYGMLFNTTLRAPERPI